MSERQRIACAPLLLAALAGSLVAARPETLLASIAVGLGAGAACGARPPGRPGLIALLTSAALAVGFNLYLVAGSPLPWPVLFGRPATREGLTLGLLLAGRLAGAAVALQGLRAVWPGERAADEIAARLAPLERIGLPVHRARATVGLALRFAPLLAEEGGRIARLQALRAGGPARGWVEGVRRRRASLVPLVVAALERAEQVALALEARHYRVRPLPARTPAPWLASGSALALFAAALLWRR